MDRREALNKLPELSAGCLDAKTEAAVRRWVEECPHCKAEWNSLQALVGTLQSLPEAHLSDEQSSRMWARCNEALFDKIEAQRLQQSRSQPGPLSWLRSQPRWGWGLLAGAAAALGAAVLAPDTPEVSRPVVIANAAPGTITSSDNAGNLQDFGRPPAYAATMVDHHAQMAADPFSDRVGSSLVSYSASYPAAGEGASR